MHIAIQIEHFDTERGGAEVYTKLLSEYLVSKGHRVTVMAMSASSVPEGVEYHPIRARGLTKWQRWISYAHECARLVEELRPDRTIAMTKGGGMDLFLPHSGTVPGDQRQNVMRQKGLFMRVVKLISMRLGLRAVVSRMLDKECYRTAKVFIALSRLVLEDMKRYYGVDEGRVRLVYNGVDTEAFRPELTETEGVRFRKELGIKAGTTVFSIVAQDFARKGVDWLLRAAAMVEGDAVWLVAGKGNIRRYQRLATRLGVKERIRFLGPVRPVQKVYAASDVYVHPAWYDPCSLVLLEALAMGLPVITTRFNGAGELVTPGQEGFVVDAPDHVDELAVHMQALMDGQRCQKMGEAARRLALENTWKRHYARMEEIISE